MKTRHRAYAYITSGRLLLLFTQPGAPDAGIQVPAGTIEAGENPRDAVMREATEETGLTGIRFIRFLARDIRDMRDCGSDELQHRWFFHLSAEGPTEETWRHGEHSEDGSLIHPFDFFWADVSALPELVAGYDDKIDLLIESMESNK
ncbi:MAG: NUDIX domain-containing protein [Gemmatimonadota bacterium]|nr:NUDIX domain-containing protein [Gemmatimonadota bacterium]